MITNENLCNYNDPRDLIAQYITLSNEYIFDYRKNFLKHKIYFLSKNKNIDHEYVKKIFKNHKDTKRYYK